MTSQEMKRRPLNEGRHRNEAILQNKLETQVDTNLKSTSYYKEKGNGSQKQIPRSMNKLTRNQAITIFKGTLRMLMVKGNYKKTHTDLICSLRKTRNPSNTYERYMKVYIIMKWPGQSANGEPLSWGCITPTMIANKVDNVMNIQEQL